MNILVVSHEFPPIGGGGANACYYLTRGYAESNHKVTILTVWYEGLKEYEVLNNVEIYRVKSKRKYKEHCSFAEMLSFIVKALPLADKIAKNRRIDVCQVFFGIPSGPIGYWLKKKYKIPYIIRFGGGDIPGFQDRFKLVYKVISPFVKIIWKNAGALIANSQGLKAFAEQFYNKGPVDVIYNGVDTEEYYPDWAKKDNTKINLVFVSRLIERKGLQFVIPKMNEINKRTNKEVHLTIVGDGPFRGELECLVQENKLDKFVHFMGQKEKAELRQYYQSGDLFVFPSKREGMPNAVLEAMACGLPIVMTPCEGSKELIVDNGRIVSVEVMCDNLIDMINSEDELSKCGAESRKRAETLFSWNSVCSQYLEVLHGVAKR